jgi:hypothetical protein
LTAGALADSTLPIAARTARWRTGRAGSAVSTLIAGAAINTVVTVAALATRPRARLPVAAAGTVPSTLTTRAPASVSADCALSGAAIADAPANCIQGTTESRSDDRTGTVIAKAPADSALAVATSAARP